MERIEEILNFWFAGIKEGVALSETPEVSKRWFGHDEETDVHILKEFGGDVKMAEKGAYDSWTESPEGYLALLILLDQFTRNIYRGTPEAFESDLKALEISLRAIKKKIDEELPLVQRQFIYLPLMHSENLEIQEMCMLYYRRMLKTAEETEDINVEYFKSTLNFAQRHYDIIKKFKRFPHRNAILKRKSTSEERTFVENPDNVF